MHGTIARDDDARRHVADDAADEDGRVDDRQRHRLTETAVAPAEVRPDVVVLVETARRPVGTVASCRSRR